MRPGRAPWRAPLSSPPRSPPSPTGFLAALHGALHRAPRGSPLSSPACSPPRGGNCTNRDATRRRHAVAMRLMVQNPHPPRALPMARSAILPGALSTVPHGVPRRAPRRSPPCPTGFPTLLPTALPTALHGWGSCVRVRPGTVDNPRNIKETCHVPRPRLTQVGVEWGSSGIERSSSRAECVLDFLHFSPREFFVGNMPKVP